MNQVCKAAATFLLCAAAVSAADWGVVVQGWLPEEADGQDWGDGYEGPKNELWNDCFLAYELFCSRPGMDSAHNRIQMLWGKGFDYSRRNDERYNPRLRFPEQVTTITDDSACLATVESTFAVLAGVMGSEDTLFCYTWGHGGHDDTAGAGWRRAFMLSGWTPTASSLRSRPCC
uniref:Uncharacterized protein n=1 Tax=candidate division WOR-3 bacterium TaxID=2052148 RepID=A0A7C4CC83_UNCW3